MLKELLSFVNWTDLIVLLIVLRCTFIGAVNGFAVELFKFLGMLFAIFVTLHYYVRFAAVLAHFIPSGPKVLHTLAFVLLWSVVVLIFVLLRMGWMLLLNADRQTAIGKWAGALLGAGRGFLVSGLFFTAVAVAGWGWFGFAVQHSFTGREAEVIVVRMYQTVYTGIAKIFPDEEPNRAVIRLVHLPDDRAK